MSSPPPTLDQPARSPSNEAAPLRVRFLGTSNEEELDPTPAFVEERLRRAGQGWWHCNKLTAELVVVRPGPAEQLTLMVEEPYGVFVHYCARDGSEELLLHNPAEPSHEDGVALYPGGAEWVVPRSNLVPVSLAMEAIQWFLATGAPLRTLSWTTLSIPDPSAAAIPAELEHQLAIVEATLQPSEPPVEGGEGS